MSVGIKDVIMGIDFDFLREQKEELISAIYQLKSGSNAEQALIGLLSLIDEIQDAVVNEGLADAETVFGLDFSD
jgi:hypothetical protein